MLKLTVLVEMLDKKNISLINFHLSLLVKPASMLHQLMKELPFKFSTLKKISKSWNQNLFSKDIILYSKRTIQVLEELLTFKARYSLPSNFLWPDSLTQLNSNMSFINKLLNQNKRKIALKNNKSQMIRIKRTKTKRSENNLSL